MGKSIESVVRLSRVVSSSAKSNKPKPSTQQPISSNRVTTPRTTKQDPIVKVESRNKIDPLDCRTPLAKVVADCAKRWFQDTLKEAKRGDSSMQVLVGQMYYSGYGVPRDPQKPYESRSVCNQDRQLQQQAAAIICILDMLGSVEHREVDIQFGKLQSKRFRFM